MSWKDTIQKIDSEEIPSSPEPPSSSWRDSIQPVDANEQNSLVPDTVAQGSESGEKSPDAIAGGSWRDSIQSIDDSSDGSIEPEMSGIDKFIKGLGEGAQQVLDPNSISEETATEDNSWQELAGEISAAIGVDIVGGIAASKSGAIAGSFFGPNGAIVGGIVGLVGYSVFTADNQEIMAEKRGDEYSGGRMVARTVLNLNPILRYGGNLSKLVAKASPKLLKTLASTESKVARAARLGTQVAGEVAVAASEGEELSMKNIAFTAAISLGLHGLAFKSGREITPTHSKFLAELAEDEDVRNLTYKAAKDIEANPKQFVHEKMDDEFVNYTLKVHGESQAGKLVPKKARVKVIMDKFTDEKKQDFFDTYRLSKKQGEGLQIAAHDARSKFRKMGSVKDPIEEVEDINLRFKDNHIAAKQVDRRIGLGFTEAINEIEAANGQHDNLSMMLYKRGQKAKKTAKKAGLSDSHVTKLMLYMSEGKPENFKHMSDIKPFLDNKGGISGKVADTIAEFSEIWSDAHRMVSSSGFDFNQQAYYVPRQYMSSFDKMQAVDEMSSNIANLVPRVDKPRIDQWSLEDLTSVGLGKQEAENVLGQVSDLMRLQRKYGKQDKVMNIESMNFLVDKLEGSGRTAKTGNSISALFTVKEDEFVESLREMSQTKLLDNYLSTNLKSAVSAKAMENAHAKLAALEKAGLTQTAEWWSNTLEDINGSVRNKYRQSISDNIKQYKYKVHAGLKNKQNTIAETMGWNAVNAVVAGTEGLQSAVYPAYLGGNFAATVRNMAQNWVQTAPFIGGAYGYNVVGRATLNPRIKQNYPKLKEMGLIAKGFRAEDITSDSRTGQAVSRMGDFVMAAYTGTDVINRLWAFRAGQLIAEDLGKGVDGAIKALDKMGAGVQATLRNRGFTTLEAMRKNVDEVGEILGVHMISETQFHYGTASKAEYLRDAGPLFSMFTKWGSTIGSDMFDIMTDKDHPVMKRALRFSERYMGPLGALSFWAAHVTEDDENINWLIKDPTSLSPAISPLEMSFTGNPVIGLGIGAAKMASGIVSAKDKGDAAKSVGKTILKKGIKSIVPLLSPAINEIDRYRKSRGDKKISDEIADSVFGK